MSINLKLRSWAGFYITSKWKFTVWEICIIYLIYINKKKKYTILDLVNELHSSPKTINKNLFRLLSRNLFDIASEKIKTGHFGRPRYVYYLNSARKNSSLLRYIVELYDCLIKWG